MGRLTKYTFSKAGVTLSQNVVFPDNSGFAMESTDANVYRSYRGASVSEDYASHPRFGSQAKVTNSLNIAYLGSRSSYYSHSASLNSSDVFDINQLVHVEYAGSSAVTSTYTGSTSAWHTETILGRTIDTIIDAYERVTSYKIGNLTATTFTYTDDLLTQIQQGARTTTLAYNSTTNLLSSITNALNQVTSFTYDSAERLASIILPDLRVIQYVYDSQGNLTSITPPGGVAHEFGMNSMELVGSYEPPPLNSLQNFNTTYAYNNDKQLTQITRPDSLAINFSYDSTTAQLNTVTGAFGTYTQVYNAQKNPSRMTAPDNSYIDLTYSNGALSGLTYYPDANMGWMYMRFANSNGRLSQEYIYDSTWSSKGVSYTYDNDEYLTGVGSLTLTYDIPDGKLTGTSISTITDEYTYNSFGEITGYVAKNSGTAFYSYTLTRDALGRISQKVEILNGVTTTFDYDYDSAGRLTQVDKNSVTYATYSYDSNSNRTGGTINGTATSAVYDDQDRMNSYNIFDYTYNLNGELASKTNTLLSTTTSFTYDVFGNLKQVALPSKTIDYEIDPLQRRLGRKVNSTVQQRYVHNIDGRLVANLNASNQFNKVYVYASKSHVPDYFIDASDNLYRMITDHLGSIRLIIEVSTGTVMQIMEHDEFGRVVQDTSPGYTPFGFAGGIYDPDTGHVRFGTRDYDPEVGRWTSKDPILFAGGINLYGYVANDPVNWIDPSGLAPGDSFPSAGEAAGDALNYINPTSIAKNLEYGGHVIRNPDGTYSATNPIQGGPAGANIGAPPAGGVVSYHTHGAYDRRYDNENFSPTDVLYNAFNGIPGYLGTPAGSIQMNSGSKFKKGLTCPQ